MIIIIRIIIIKGFYPPVGCIPVQYSPCHIASSPAVPASFACKKKARTAGFEITCHGFWMSLPVYIHWTKSEMYLEGIRKFAIYKVQDRAHGTCMMHAILNKPTQTVHNFLHAIILFC